MTRKVEFPVKKVIGFKSDMVEAVDDWRRKQPDIPNRSEAIRCLIRKGLENE